MSKKTITYIIVIILAIMVYSNYFNDDNKETNSNIQTQEQIEYENTQEEPDEQTVDTQANQQAEKEPEPPEVIEEKEAEEKQVEIPNVHNVEIYVNYVESTGLNYSDDAYVFLDDSEIGLVKNGESVVFTGSLEEGTHQIYLKRKSTIRKYNTNKIKFDVSKENTVFSITAKENSVSGLKISID